MKYFLYVVILLITISGFGCKAQTSQQKNYRYEPATVTLTGLLVEKMYYGPPGYGEDPKKDSKEYEYIIILDRPITAVADPNDQFNETRSDITELQVMNLTQLKLDQFMGKQIRAEGKLSCAITGHHHTPVLIEIDSVVEMK